MRNMRRKTLLLSAALLLAASHTFAQVSTEVINGLSYKINARTCLLYTSDAADE